MIQNRSPSILIVERLLSEACSGIFFIVERLPLRHETVLVAVVCISITSSSTTIIFIFKYQYKFCEASCYCQVVLVVEVLLVVVVVLAETLSYSNIHTV